MDRQEFEEQLPDALRKLRTFLRLKEKDAGVVEDIVQEVHVKLVMNYAGVRSLMHYTRSVGRNLLVDHVRSQTRRANALEEYREANQVDLSPKSEGLDRLILMELLNSVCNDLKLTAFQQQILHKYLLGAHEGAREFAEKHGIPVERVYREASAIRKRISKWLEDH